MLWPLLGFRSLYTEPPPDKFDPFTCSVASCKDIDPNPLAPVVPRSALPLLSLSLSLSLPAPGTSPRTLTDNDNNAITRERRV